VDSALLELVPLEAAERPVPRAQLGAFAEFVHAGFAQPRKQLANSLAQGLGADRAPLIAWLAALGIDASRRPQELTVAEWATLFAARASTVD
jgi:16S rRNA (adenine1518-N6/adenine1519-N6)-dimethyltransferase